MCDLANQRDYNRCWKCGGYDWCETDAHEAATWNFILVCLPITILIDIGIVMAFIKFMGS